MRKELVLALTVVGGALVPVVAQDKPPAQVPVPVLMPSPSGQPAPSGAARQIPLKVQLTLSRYQGEKKISSTPYVLGVLTNAQKTSLRMGVQVPIIQTVFGAKDAGGSIPQSSYTYKDVGTNIDCQAQDVGNGLFNLTITVEDSTIQLDRPESPQQKDEKRMLADVPAFRSFRASFAMVLRDGQTMQYASATDPISGEVVRVDVNLTMAK